MSEGRDQTLTARSSMLRFVGGCLIDAHVGAAKGGDVKVVSSVDDVSCGITRSD